METELILLAIIIGLNVLTVLLGGVNNKTNGRRLDQAADRFADRIRKQQERSQEMKQQQGERDQESEFSQLQEPFRSMAREMRRKGLI